MTIDTMDDDFPKRTMLISQNDLEECVRRVLSRLELENTIPYEMITGDLVNRCEIAEGIIRTYRPQQFLNGLEKVLSLKNLKIQCFSGKSEVQLHFLDKSLLTPDVWSLILRVTRMYGFRVEKVMPSICYDVW